MPVASDDAAEGQGCLSGAIFQAMGSGPARIGCQRILSEVESGTGVGFESAVQALRSSRHRNGNEVATPSSGQDHRGRETTMRPDRFASRGDRGSRVSIRRDTT